MIKYILIASNSLQEFLAYRLNFFLWRLRVIISVLISFFLWQTIYAGRSQVFGYDKDQMLTYIILITFLNGLVLSTQTFRIADEINTGTISNFLIRPMNYFGFIAARDIADKTLNTVFSIFEMVMLVILLKPPIFLQTSIYWLSLFFISSILAAVLFFGIGSILSLIGFWSRETWAPRFVFFILVTFLAGTYFPLDIFPRPIFDLLALLPFAYLIFFPLKIYLGNLSNDHLLGGFLIMFIWIFIVFVALQFIWKKGLRKYTSEGR